MPLARYHREDRLQILEDLEANSLSRIDLTPPRAWRPNNLDEGEEVGLDGITNDVGETNIVAEDENEQRPTRDRCRSTVQCLKKHQFNILNLLIITASVIGTALIIKRIRIVNAGKRDMNTQRQSSWEEGTPSSSPTIKYQVFPTYKPTVWEDSYAPTASPSLSPIVEIVELVFLNNNDTNVAVEQDVVVANVTNGTYFEGNNSTAADDLFLEGNMTTDATVFIESSNETASTDSTALETDNSTSSTTETLTTSSTAVATTVDGSGSSTFATSTTTESSELYASTTTTTAAAAAAATTELLSTSSFTSDVATSTNEAATSTTPTTKATTTTAATTETTTTTAAMTEATTTSTATTDATTTTIEVTTALNEAATSSTTTTTTSNPYLCNDNNTTSGKYFKFSMVPTTSATLLELLKEDVESGEYNIIVNIHPSKDDDSPFAIGTSYVKRLCVLPGKYKFVIVNSEEACYDGYLRGSLMFEECGDGEYDFEVV